MVSMVSMVKFHIFRGGTEPLRHAVSAADVHAKGGGAEAIEAIWGGQKQDEDISKFHMT